MSIEQLVTLLLSLGGVGTLVAAIVNALKTSGVVKDGQAPTFVLGFNLLGLVILFLVGLFAPATDLTQLDSTAAQVAQLLTIVVGLLVQFGGSKLAHGTFKGVPVIGKSFSAAKPSA